MRDLDFKNENKNGLSIALGILSGIYWKINSSDSWEEIKHGFELVPDQLQLRLLTEKEKELISSFTKDFERPHLLPERCTTLELKPITLDLVIGGEKWDSIHKALLAFRLLKAGGIYLDSVYIPFTTPEMGMVTIRTLPVPPITNHEYVFNPYEVENIIEILQRLLNIDNKKNSSIRVSCDRFDRSYHDIYPEDKLIDLCIAFEALFLRGEYKQSELGMGQVIGLACSMLLGKNNLEREDVSEVIEAGFNLRNRIVHGRDYDSNRISEIVPNLEDYLRQSILRLIPYPSEKGNISS